MYHPREQMPQPILQNERLLDELELINYENALAKERFQKSFQNNKKKN